MLKWAIYVVWQVVVTKTNKGVAARLRLGVIV